MPSMEPAPPPTKRGQWLRRARERRCLTQEQLAECIGTTRLSVSRWENDAARPSIFFRRKLCELFGLTPEELGFAPAQPSGRSPHLPAAPSISAVNRTSSVGEPLSLPPLPTPATSLLGRDRELDQAHELLRAARVRLLTLCGPGGVGKTRLAIELARRASHLFADGVVFVSLTSVLSPGAVAPAIAAALGLRDTGTRLAEEAMDDVLRRRHLLLVLDSFEHVLGAAPLVIALLEESPGLAVLATSRAALAVRGEQRFPVSPLALPDLTRPSNAADIARAASVALFVERARQTMPDFALNAANAPLVARICARVDGLPLAIELAAPWIRLYAPYHLLSHLNQHRLAVLRGGPADAPDRHRTMRDAIAWSYHLLSARQQAVFRRLAVCVGGCSLSAAEALCADAPQSPDCGARDALLTLLDHHLLVRLMPDDVETRIGMLETVREYALEQLDEHGERPGAQRAHADHFVTFTEEAEPHLKGEQQRNWLEQLRRDHDNLRAALDWTLNAGDADLGLRLVAALWRFWLIHGFLKEGRRWLELALAHDAERAAAGSVTVPDASLRLRARALYGAGMLAFHQADYTAARVLTENSLALWRELEARLGIAQSLNSLALVMVACEDVAAAAALFEESLSIKRQLGDEYGVAQTLNNLGHLLVCRGDLDSAVPLYEESLSIKRRLGDAYTLATTLANLGDLAHRRGEYEQATAFLQESLEVRRALQDTEGIGQVLILQGNLAHSCHDPLAASRLYQEALGAFQHVGALDGILLCLESLAVVWYEERLLAAAAQISSATTALRAALEIQPDPVERADVERGLAALRAALRKGAYAAEVAAGRRMTVEEAIKIAQQELRHVTPTTRVAMRGRIH